MSPLQAFSFNGEIAYPFWYASAHYTTLVMEFTPARSGSGSVTRARTEEKKSSIIRSRKKQLYRNQWEAMHSQNGSLYLEYLNSVATAYTHLSPTELRICACIKLGMRSWQIAEAFHLTEKSVENYRSRVRKKLRLERQVQLESVLHTLK